MTTKLDELKALMEWPDRNDDMVLKPETLEALIAAVEALTFVMEETYGGQKMSADTRRKARAALAPFGENDEQT